MAGKNGTSPLPSMKALNVSVWFVEIGTVALGPGTVGLIQCTVAGSGLQIERTTGRLTQPVSTVATMRPAPPTLTMATEKTPTPAVPTMTAMPSLVGVAASATMSGPAPADAEKSRVFTPK